MEGSDFAFAFGHMRTRVRDKARELLGFADYFDMVEQPQHAKRVRDVASALLQLADEAERAATERRERVFGRRIPA